MGKPTVGTSVLTTRVFSFANVTAAENFPVFDSVFQKGNISLTEVHEFDFDLHI